MTHSRLPNFSRLVSGGAEEAGMKGGADADASRRNAKKACFTRISRGLFGIILLAAWTRR